ncbi:MAG: SDR family oxidoreductase [Lachnospiraceae bacterium]|nr:SDR family oxidoreductase [Lachnospiraceae bacterium]
MKLACITGASSGIGREFARQLSNQGYDLILVARSKDKLEQIAKKCRTRAEVIAADLSKEEACREIAERMKERELTLFINNAGFGNIGLFESCDLDRDLEMIDVNVRAVHILTHEILEQMKARNKGTILNTASVAGLMPGGPLMATYYATKAYVVSITNAIAAELKESGSLVRIAALCPGPVDTDFNDVAGVQFSLPGISARNCVMTALKELKKGRIIIVPGLIVKAGSVLAKLLPRALVMRVLMKGQNKKIEG